MHPLQQPRNAPLISISHLVIQRPGEERRGQDQSDSPESPTAASTSQQSNRPHCATGLIYMRKCCRFACSKQRGVIRARPQGHGCGDRLLEPCEGPLALGLPMGVCRHLPEPGRCHGSGELLHQCFLSLSVAEMPPVARACGKQEGTYSHFQNLLRPGQWATHPFSPGLRLPLSTRKVK